MKNLLIALTLVVFFSSCGDDDDTLSNNFTVTIENVFAAKSYFNTGSTGLIMPGQQEQFAFDAGKGHFLSFATMFVQSNDLFYAPAMNGIALYDADGNPKTGDITAEIELWDAGTEVNEEPGVGANQAPRQAGPNTGETENGTVKLIADVADGYTYPATASVIKVTLAHDGGTRFTATIENISNTSTLPTPFAPGVWVINTENQMPLFATGAAASSGLEGLAEDGTIETLNSDLSASTGLVSPFAPGAYSITSDANDLWNAGIASSDALEALAEDGSPSGFSNAFNTPVGASAAGPIFPGDSYSFSFTAEEGDRLNLATMLVQSNDWFIGLSNLELFNNGAAVTGDVTNQAVLYDSGTEVDEYPGAGNFQAPRQAGPNTGTDENGVVERETETFDNLPAISEMLKITIEVN